LKQSSLVIQYVMFSIITVLLLISVTLFNYSSTVNIRFNDRLLVGIIFIFSCIIGITLALYPGWIKRHTFLKNQKTSKKSKKISIRDRIGHHPDCNNFNNHRIRIKSKVYCAGCLGISIGCLISIILMIFYILNFFRLSYIIFFYLIIVGFVIIGLVFVEIIKNNGHTIIHIISNSFLVIGFFIILISIIEITGNKNFGIISIIFSFLWLDTRIQLSKLKHNRICKSCIKSCKMY
jgi:hypothetical protein